MYNQGTIHTYSTGWSETFTLSGVRRAGLSQQQQPHLLPILVLQVQPGLDVTASLLKGLALRHLSRVVCADANDVGTEEQQHVGTQLQGVAEGDG